jgi:hypothetical protein
MSQSIFRADAGTRGPPPLPKRSLVPTADVIEVDVRWLVRVPSSKGGRNADRSPGTPPPLPSRVEATAPGKLPPALPRPDGAAFAKVGRVLTFEKE